MFVQSVQEGRPNRHSILFDTYETFTEERRKLLNNIIIMMK